MEQGWHAPAPSGKDPTATAWFPMARPSSPLISRDGAVKAALEVIDRYGLEACSLAAVAKELRVKAPSLYYHFRDKTELFAEVAKQILLEADDVHRVTTADWKEALIALTLSARRAILNHPNAAPLLLTYPPRHVALRGYERSLRLFGRTGIPLEYHMIIINGLDSLLFGSALFSSAARVRDMDPFPPYDPAQFPSLAAALKANPLDDQAMFEKVARSFLDGVAAQFPRARR